jgi:hypothetical protein
MRSFLAPILAALFVSACGDDTVYDDFATEIRVRAPSGFNAVVEQEKRFRISQEPTFARFVSIDAARIGVAAPAGADLSAIESIEVYVLDGEEMTLVASGNSFAPDERFRELDVVFDADLRDFVGADSRFRMLFVVEPSSWYRPFPAEGVSITARARIAIDL